MPGGVRGAGAGARPSQEAYFVALAGILVLLLLLCCYFFYFCIKRVKELNAELREESPTQPVRPSSVPQGAQYAVQPAVREGATALAQLCRQLPSAPAGGSVFPAASSPAAARAPHSPPEAHPPPPPAPDATAPAAKAPLAPLAPCPPGAEVAAR